VPYMPTGEWYHEAPQRPQAPKVSDADAAALIDGALKELEHAAARQGATAEQIRERIGSYRENFRVNSAPAGVTVQVHTHGVWGATTKEQALAHLGYDLAKRAREKAAFGDDPAELLRAQLEAGGMPKDRAHDLSRDRAFRDPDGRIAVRFPNTHAPVRVGDFWLEKVARDLLDAGSAAANQAKLQEDVQALGADPLYTL
jgi:hypothetical protein